MRETCWSSKRQVRPLSDRPVIFPQMADGTSKQEDPREQRHKLRIETATKFITIKVRAMTLAMETAIRLSGAR